MSVSQRYLPITRPTIANILPTLSLSRPCLGQNRRTKHLLGSQTRNVARLPADGRWTEVGAWIQAKVNRRRFTARIECEDYRAGHMYRWENPTRRARATMRFIADSPKWIALQVEVPFELKFEP